MRNFEIVNNNVTVNMIAVEAIVTRVLKDIADGQKIDKAIHFANCPELKILSHEEPWLIPHGSTNSAVDGFVIYGNEIVDGEVESFEICTVIVPELQHLTKTA